MNPSCLTFPSMPKRFRQEMNARVSHWNQGTDSVQTEKRIFPTQSPAQSFYWWSQLQEFLSSRAAVWAPASPWNQDTPPSISEKCHELNDQMDQLVQRGWMGGREHVLLLLERVRWEGWLWAALAPWDTEIPWLPEEVPRSLWLCPCKTYAASKLNKHRRIIN